MCQTLLSRTLWLCHTNITQCYWQCRLRDKRDVWSLNNSATYLHSSLLDQVEEHYPKISPVRDWWSTPKGAFKHSWPWPWPWIGSYGIPSCITHRALSTYQISLKSEKLFVDRWTDVPTDGHFRPPLILLGSTWRSRPNNTIRYDNFYVPKS